MAAKKNVRTRIKRSERKNIAVGAAHIKSTSVSYTHLRTVSLLALTLGIKEGGRGNSSLFLYV